MKKRIGKLNLHKGSQCWYARIDGHMKYLTKKGGTKEEAELALARIRLELSIPEKTNTSPDEETVANLFGLYLDKVKNNSSLKNFVDKERILNKFVAVYGSRTLNSLKPLEISDWLQQTPTRTSGAGKRQYFGHLAAAFNWLQKNIRTTCKPHIGVTAPRKCERGEEYVLTSEEFACVLQHMKQPYEDAVMVLWETGARPSEIINATIDEYIPDKHLIKKKHHKTSHLRHQRIIVLSDHAEDIIRRRINGRKSGNIFVTPSGKPLSGRWCHEQFVAAARKCGRTKPVCLYSLRHSFAVRHLERLMPINIVAGWLGNTTQVCEQHYAHTISMLATRRDLLGS